MKRIIMIAQSQAEMAQEVHAGSGRYLLLRFRDAAMEVTVEFNRGKSWRQLRWCSHQCVVKVLVEMASPHVSLYFTFFLSFWVGGK